jgi:hypothetical protein
MQELRQSNGFNDLAGKFTFEITRYNGAKSDRDGYIFKDDREGKVYIMQCSAILQSSYSAEEIAQRDRLNASEPLKTGDVVLFEGKPHKVKINGDYSDAGVLIPIV